MAAVLARLNLFSPFDAALEMFEQLEGDLLVDPIPSLSVSLLQWDARVDVDGLLEPDRDEDIDAAAPDVPAASAGVDEDAHPSEPLVPVACCCRCTLEPATGRSVQR